MKKRIIFLLVGIAVASTIMAQDHGHQKNSEANSANEYMHRSSVDNLARHFESSERDAYQHPDKVLKFLGELKGKRVMDLGAGSGYFSVRLASVGAQSHCCGCQ